MKPLFVVLSSALMLSLVLSGCLQGEPAGGDDTGAGGGTGTFRLEDLPVAVLWCVDPVAMTGCNQEMTPDAERQGNEVTIAVDPTNPKNIVGGAKDYFPLDAGECVWDGIYVSHDGGITYEDRSFDGSPWRLTQDPNSFEPNYASQFWCTTDPVVYFNTRGVFYYLLMAYQADRVSGSDTCQDICPMGSLNDWAFNRATQIVAVSFDGGDTFNQFTPVLEGSFPVSFHDKGWVAASADGTIHVMWLASFLPGNTYFRSTDGGRTYTDPEVLSLGGDCGGQGSFVDVGMGDEVYASWTCGGAIQLRRSMDKGATWDAQRAVVEVDGVSMPGLSGRDFRGGFPAMATDRWEESPFGGAIYYVWQDERGSEAGTTVMFSASYDGGETFSDPVRINDDVDAEGISHDYHLFPVVGVSQGGVIDVSWMDTRDTDMAILQEGMGGTPELVGEAHQKLDQYYAYSLDGGKTWSQNFRVRDVEDGGWDPQYSHHQNGRIFIGDYNDIDSSWGAAHPVWPDTRSMEVVDVYTAVVQRPLFAEGWDEARKASLRDELVDSGMIPADHPYLYAE